MFIKSNKKYGWKPIWELEQVQDRVSGLRNKIDIKEKTEEFIDKTQELQKEYIRTLLLHEKTKSANHGSWEEEVEDKGAQNIFNKIIAEKFPNLEKVVPHLGTGSL
jgi:hypothetical protein